jgi:hypothetical protein
VTSRDAKQLGYQVFREWGSTKLPGFTVLIADESPYSGFYMIDGIFSNPGPGSYLVGHLLVEQTTGDVLDPFTCEVFDYPSLRRLQSKIRRRMRLTDRKYREIKIKKPPC